MASKENMTEEERGQAGLNYVRLNHLLSHLGMRTLRLLFRDRYNAMTHIEWENGSLSMNEDFIKKEGSSPKLTKEHKEALESADINNWDVTLLVHILLSMDLKMTELKHLKHKKSEHEALKVLKNLLNSLVHIPGQVIPNKEFGRQWKISRDALLLLGAREKEIEQLRKAWKLESLECNTGALDQDNEVKSTKIRNRAKELVTAGKLQEGVQLYSEALLLAGLSTIEKSCIYSSRSQAYIKQIEDHLESLSKSVIQKYLVAAMEDAGLVIKLQPKWWKGHFLEGKCFQLENLVNEAIDSYEAALSIKPGSEEIIKARDVCRFIQSVGDDKNLDSLFTPSLAGAGLQSREQVCMFVDLHRELMTSSDPWERAKGCVFIGNLYLRGDGGVPLNKNKSRELFQEAAKVGSPDGAYNAGLCFLRGIGVKQNIPEAVKYFEAAAKHQVKAGLKFLLENDSIAKAKGMLGTLYLSGAGKPRNYVKAAEWLRRSALEGFRIAATNLANMLSVGMGIPKNLKRALQYQRLAVEHSLSDDHMRSLARLYAYVGDLPQACYWYQRAINSGLKDSALARLRFESQFRLKHQELEAIKKKLPAHVLSSGVPIHILCDRYLKRLLPGWTEIVKTHLGIFHVLFDFASAPSELAKANPAVKIDEMKKYAAKGRGYSRIFLNALKHFQAGTEAIKLLTDLGSVTHAESSRTSMELLQKLALSEIAACYIAEGAAAASMSAECQEKILEIAEEFSDADGEKDDCDLFYARVVRLNISKQSIEETLKIAQECKKLYPQQSHFHIMHAKVLGQLQKHEEGLKVAEEGLKLFPDNVELLFYKALFMCSTWKPDFKYNYCKHVVEEYINSGEPLADKEERGKEAMLTWMLSAFSHTSVQVYKSQIKAFEEFIRKAPEGHPQVPEAYYWIANLFASEDGFEEFGTYYALGVEAEQELLPNFLPYDSSVKRAAEQCLKLFDDFMEAELRRSACTPNILERLLEPDPKELAENRNLKLTNPKRIVVVKGCRSRFANWEANRLQHHALHDNPVPYATGTDGKHRQRAPCRLKIPSLKSIRFADMDPTIDQVHEGRVISLTIMEELTDWIPGCIQSVVKDDDDDFNIICFNNFDRSEPSTRKQLCFGSRIRLMNPYLVPQQVGPVVRVDDPNSVVLVSSGEGKPMCRYCWKPSPGPHCSKCKTAQYCNKECQKLDWEVLGHKELCKFLSKHQKGSDI